MKNFFLVIMLLTFALPAFAQEKEHEISSEIPALSDFHEVIYPIWHMGWPQKDIKLLSSMVPELTKKYEAVAAAKLPGILRDKQVKWDEAFKKFTGYYNDYKTAVEKKDSVGLLNAAEKLHMQYEMLARVVKPKLPEVDAFHQILYKLHHYYVPEYQIAKIKEAVAQLKEKVALIPNAKLSTKQKVKEEAFKKLTAELTAAVDNLDKAVKEGKKKNIQEAEDAMHSKYEELEKVFD
jgi:hypothetical protein